MFDQQTLDRAETVIRQATAKSVVIATAESCTGGMIAAALTEIAGSSAVLDRGFVTYSNEAKTEMLDVSAQVIASHGAVSEETARAMAQGAVHNSRAGISVSVTGIAGPGGGTAEKPVGLVWFGRCANNTVTAQQKIFASSTRHGVRTHTVNAALDMLLETLAG